MQVKGFLVNAGKYTTGNNDKGPWSVQTITLKDYDKQTRVKVWNRPDFTSAKGKFVEIDGAQNGKGRNQAGDEIDILEVKSKDAKIDVKDKPSGGQSGGQRQPGASGAPTQVEYDAVVVHGAKVAAGALSAVGLVSAEAVAEIVKGYMVAFAKGDFVPAKPTQKEQPKSEEIDPENIPL